MARPSDVARADLRSASDAAVFETSVVPRYLSLFADPAIAKIVAGRDARVCHLDCRTGSFDDRLFAKLPNAHVFGCDASEPAIALARAKATAAGLRTADYRVVDGVPLPFPPRVFSHALVTNPRLPPPVFPPLFDELARLLAPRGQAVVAVALRDSFVELADLFRESALRSEAPELLDGIDAGALARPNEELVARLLEAAGFEHVEVDVLTRSLSFASGRDWLDDPATRLAILPDLAAMELAAVPDVADRLSYVRDAIDTYWSDGSFELTLRIGVASGRRKA